MPMGYSSSCQLPYTVQVSYLWAQDGPPRLTSNYGN